MPELVRRSSSPIRLLALGLLLWSVAAASMAVSPDAVAREAEGFDDPAQSPVPWAPDPAAHARALQLLGTTGVLLIPESSNDRVMAFDPTTGDLVDADFVPADPTNLSTPIQAILSASGNSILVSDQIDDVVQEYDLDGNYIGVFAPAGGVNTAILDNIRGIALRPNGNLLVTVGGGANDDTVAEFDTGGNYLGNFVTAGSGGLGSPFDVFEVVTASGGLSPGQFLVGGIDSDAIHRYDATGAPLANLAPINTFPEQVFQIPSGVNAGNVLVANFSPSANEGVIELDGNGALVDRYDPTGLSGYRGAYQLGNGNILTTTGNGVHEIDRAGNLVEDKITGVSARFIQYVSSGTPVIGVTPSPISSYQPRDAVAVVAMTIDNSGDGALDWSIAEAPADCAAASDVSWLSVSPTAGSTAPAATSVVDVAFDSTGLAAGTYTALLCVASNDPQNPLVAVPVQLLVAATLQEIPTLSTLGLAALAALLVAFAALALRRRSTT